MMELWDVYDKNRNFLNRTIVRGEAFAPDEYYVCCEIWITNSDNKMLITRRHPRKKLGGMWEFIGGGVLAGETTLQAAIREVKEEVGIELLEGNLKFVDTYQRKNYFMDIYIAQVDVKIEELVLQENEVTDAAWATSDEIGQMFEDGMFVKSVWERYK